MPEARPYIKLGIADLESIFEAAHSDRGICQALANELSHRSTERAKTLLLRIQRVQASSPSPEPAPNVVTTRRQARDATNQKVDGPAGLPPVIAVWPAAEHAAQPRRDPLPCGNPSLAVLSAWTALEALSPQTYRYPADLANGDKQCVARIDEGDLPWSLGERSRSKRQLYYQVILGSIPVDRATDELIKTFGEDEERGRKEREKAAIAAILLDRNGLLLDANAVAVSSFAWALPIALAGELTGLNAWTAAERELVEGLTKQLDTTDAHGNKSPLDAATIRRAFQWLVEALKLPAGLREEPSFALRVFHYYKAKNPPEVALLNSFFLADLARAATLVGAGKQGRALSRYLGMEQVPASGNLLESPEVIEKLVSPTVTPRARWPAPGGHPLVTLQQAAVNAARSDLNADGAGIVAVNGPPGTGKTTLLRDVVAACVLDRAAAMARFDDPVAAFRTTGQKVAAGDRAFLHLYGLDESLKGHEVLVASSNNKAVENVSRELPSLKAIGREMAYFRTVSDRLLSRRSDDGELLCGEPTWGLIAAVLGNALNRSAFQQALWWDEDRSLRLYLKAAKGDDVVREVTDTSGKIVRREVPTVIQAEAPPSPEQAKVNWRKTRERFTALQADVEVEFRALETVRQTCLKLAPAREAFLAARAAFDIASSGNAEKTRIATEAVSTRHACEGETEAARRREQQALAERPGWWHRLFNTNVAQRWRALYSPLAAELSNSRVRTAKAAALQEVADNELRQAEARLKSSQARLESAQTEFASVEQSIEQHRHRLGARMVDEQFFQQDHAHWNLASPWLPDTLHRKREDLFALALDIHKAFIDSAAQKIAHNLGILVGAMHAGALKEDAKRTLLGDLWSTLFLVCPVVSTTFASVDRMLGDLPPSSFGWVLVDEAGQATPQSAVGLLMRAKKAIIVGDPLQIPPVVSLPQRLVVEVAKYFGVDPNRWLAPDASVQTLADEASRLKAEFRADVGVREVGLPLLVHRRCQEPMFGISNRIAYDGQMVFAAGEVVAGPVYRSLGVSRWLNVDAPADSKWCPAEGEAVLALLEKLAAAGVLRPDLYVITPFRVVAHELRERIRKASGLLDRLGIDSTEWLRDRVGTIHTFQGKEAEAVVAVLGAPAAAHLGARRWAASSPNILNVMVSRAKQGLYVIGSHAAWSTIGHGRALASALPLEGHLEARPE